MLGGWEYDYTKFICNSSTFVCNSQPIRSFGLDIGIEKFSKIGVLQFFVSKEKIDEAVLWVWRKSCKIS